MKDEELLEKIKTLIQLDDCLVALKYIRENPRLISQQAVEIIQIETKRRNKEDPVYELLEHCLKLIDVLIGIVEHFKPRPAHNKDI